MEVKYSMSDTPAAKVGVRAELPEDLAITGQLGALAKKEVAVV